MLPSPVIYVRKGIPSRRSLCSCAFYYSGIHAPDIDDPSIRRPVLKASLVLWLLHVVPSTTAQDTRSQILQVAAGIMLFDDL